MRALRQRRCEDVIKLEVLKRQIDAGIDALNRGEFIEIDDAELDVSLEGLNSKTR